MENPATAALLPATLLQEDLKTTTLSNELGHDKRTDRPRRSDQARYHARRMPFVGIVNSRVTPSPDVYVHYDDSISCPALEQS